MVEMNEIDFLKNVLQKQFELAGCTETIDEVLLMDQIQQTEFWNKYTLTGDQYASWKKYFETLFAEYQPELDNKEIMETIFNDLSSQWSFEVKKKRGRKKKAEN